MNCNARTSRGFSMLELMVVITIIGVLAIAAVPAVGTARDTAQAAARDEVRRQLAVARAFAVQTGDAAGVRFDLDADTIEPLAILGAGMSPLPMPDALGNDTPLLSLPAHFGGVSLDAVTDGEGQSHTSGSAAIIWFGFDGLPERRDSSGGLLGTATHDISIVSSVGWSVAVHAGSGMIE